MSERELTTLEKLCETCGFELCDCRACRGAGEPMCTPEECKIDEDSTTCPSFEDK